MILFVFDKFPFNFKFTSIIFAFWHQFILFILIILFALYLTSAANLVILIVVKTVLQNL